MCLYAVLFCREERSTADLSRLSLSLQRLCRGFAKKRGSVSGHLEDCALAQLRARRRLAWAMFLISADSFINRNIDVILGEWNVDGILVRRAVSSISELPIALYICRDIL